MTARKGVGPPLIALATMIGCSGGISTAPSSTPGIPGTPANPVGTTTITITTSGVSPKAILVSRGAQVTFINNDTVPHDMSSDPHPDHTDCPAINQAGFLLPGQSRQTGNLTTPRVCGFHDHEHETVVALQGTITVQ